MGVILLGHVSVFVKGDEGWYAAWSSTICELGPSEIVCGSGIGCEISSVPRRMAALVLVPAGKDEAMEECDLWFEACMTDVGYGRA